MLDFIDRLREKSESYRLRVALITASALTSILFIAWIFSFIGSSPEIVKEARPQAEPSIFSTLRGGFNDVLRDSSKQLQQLKEDFGTIEIHVAPEENL